MPYAEFRLAHGDRPRSLIIVGGVLLTVLAGTINVTMLAHGGVPVSHMSGAVSRLGMDLGGGHRLEWLILALVISFALGAMLTGAMVGMSAHNASRRRYAAVLLCEAAALAGAGWASERD